jgi:hypothetical protein
VLRTLPILIAIAVVVLLGKVGGNWTDRWTIGHEIEPAAVRLGRVSLALGDWTGQELEFNAREHAGTGIRAGLLRRYVNRRTDARVTVLIVCGRPGPISVHTPEVCYAAAGYEVIGDRIQATVPLGPETPPARFWKVRLRKLGAVVPEMLGVHYAWSATGLWRAPEREPRLEFAGRPSLYKLYVIDDRATAEPAATDPTIAFIQALLPELERSLFSAS